MKCNYDKHLFVRSAVVIRHGFEEKITLLIEMLCVVCEGVCAGECVCSHKWLLMAITMDGQFIGPIGRADIITYRPTAARPSTGSAPIRWRRSTGTCRGPPSAPF